MELKHLFIIAIIISQLLLVALDLPIVIFGFYAQKDVETSKNENISDIGVNWSRAPITSFGVCGIDKELTDAFWDGIVSGCSTLSGNAKRKDCQGDREGHINPINVVSAIEPVRLTKWKGIDFCGKTLGNYLELNIVSKTENCPVGTVKCGTIDSLDNILCVESTSNCPITSIKMTAAAPSAGSTFIKGDNVYLQYSKEPIEGDIPVQFKVSEGKICADLAYRDIKRKPFLLEFFALNRYCSSIVGNTAFNNEFTPLDVHELRAFYTENQIIDTIEDINGIDTSDYDTPIYLHTRSFIGLTKECRATLKEKDISIEDFKIVSGKTQEAEDILFSVNQFTFILLFAKMVGLFAVFLTVKDSCLFHLSAFGLIGIASVCHITLAIFSLTSMNKLSQARFDFDFIEAESCSELIVNESIGEFLSTVDSSYFYSLLYICFTPLSLITLPALTFVGTKKFRDYFD